jgi:predicted O-linked N-acetylglucosamine transferase (SPINDLY family)
MTIDQALRNALGHHQAGRLAEAEGIYRQILTQSPDHAEALHLLGVLAVQVGRADAAIELIGRAIAINPTIAEYHANLGESYRRAGRYEAAIASFHRAIALKPGLADAHNNLGNALRDTGRPAEAIAAFHRAIDFRPEFAQAHSNLGNALRDLDRRDEAIAAYRRAITVAPAFAEAYTHLGVSLFEAGRGVEAIAAHRRAIALEPDRAQAHYNLGCVLAHEGKLDEAITSLLRAVELAPDLADAYNNLGVVFRKNGREEEAIAAYRRVIELQDDHADAHNNLGNVLGERGLPDLAIAAYRRAIALRPDFSEAHNNLGNLMRDQGDLDEALACYRRALTANPQFSRAASNLVLTLHYHPDYDAQAILAEHRRWAEKHAAPLVNESRPHDNERAPDRRLRVGFLSPDFREHPVGRLLLPLFAHRDQRRFEFIGYSDVRTVDELTEKLEALADCWHDTSALSDAQLAQRIRDDRIDILVDLALHTLDNRLLVFAREPAPVQVTMLGMPATTGLATIDYRLTDPYLDPPGATDGDYTEQSIRLPHCFWCYEPPREAPPVGPLPALTNGFVTFGCLNQFTKVSRAVWPLWVRILQSLPGARLVLLCPPGGHRDAVRARLQDADIAEDRVEFVARGSHSEYFHRYLELDLSLDPFPYNGHTSTLDSLWMGVPVITLSGRTAVGRGGDSILSNAGLPELISRAPDQYVEIAVQWAEDRARLSALRAGLRERMRSSVLMDGPQYAADVEAAVRWMWTTWCGR